MTYDVGNPGPGLEQAQKCVGVKSVNKKTGIKFYLHDLLSTCLVINIARILYNLYSTTINQSLKLLIQVKIQLHKNKLLQVF